MDRMGNMANTVRFREIAVMACTAKGNGSTSGSGGDSSNVRKSCAEVSVSTTDTNDVSAKTGGETAEAPPTPNRGVRQVYDVFLAGFFADAFAGAGPGSFNNISII